mmetsp:Transcript_28778/g.55152  ORF Transcript_28778/g.55152 Transcript_28778/m.55152 type:complete len:237 (-) Transcript_28778:2616-3326(-)
MLNQQSKKHGQHKIHAEHPVRHQFFVHATMTCGRIQICAGGMGCTDAGVATVLGSSGMLDCIFTGEITPLWLPLMLRRTPPAQRSDPASPESLPAFMIPLPFLSLSWFARMADFEGDRKLPSWDDFRPRELDFMLPSCDFFLMEPDGDLSGWILLLLLEINDRFEKNAVLPPVLLPCRAMDSWRACSRASACSSISSDSFQAAASSQRQKRAWASSEISNASHLKVEMILSVWMMS